MKRSRDEGNTAEVKRSARRTGRITSETSSSAGRQQNQHQSQRRQPGTSPNSSSDKKPVNSTSSAATLASATADNARERGRKSSNATDAFNATPSAALASAPSPTPPAASATPNNLLFIVGTYHSIIAGLVLRQKKFFLKFSSKHHVGCVNCVSLCDKYMASSGTDERLFLYTVKDRGGLISDLGSVAPASEVTSLAWHGSTHLLCGCADGTVAVYRSRDWESVFAIQVHERRVVDVLLHPSGAVALTLGADRHVAVLDMEAGKLVTKIKLPLSAGTPVKLLLDSSPSSSLGSRMSGGRRIIVVCEFRLTLVDLNTMEVLATADMERQPPYQIHTAVIVGGGSGGAVVVGCEDGRLRYLELRPASERSHLVFGELRVTGVPLELLASSSSPSTAAATSPASSRDPTKVKHPIAHAARIKALSCCVDSRLLVSADANGAVIAVLLPPQEVVDRRLATQSTSAGGAAAAPSVVVAADATETLRLAPKYAAPLDVEYFASANCQGRLTSVAMLRR